MPFFQFRKVYCCWGVYILPQDQKNYMCLECGQKYPIEQQQPKGKLSTIDESSSNSIGVVQPQNYQGRKPRPLRERSPIEEELTAKGYTVIDSQWIIQSVHCEDKTVNSLKSLTGSEI